MTITQRTINATHDELNEAEYRDLYQELRGYDPATGKYLLSLRGFAESLDSGMSHAVWAKYDAGTMSLSRRMKNELRRMVGLLPLPPSVEEAMKDVSPDAAVVAVGDAVFDYVVVTNRDLVTVYDAAGHLVVRSAREAEQAVTEVTPRKRLRYVRPAASPQQEQRRAAVGAKWQDVIEAGLAALEAQSIGDPLR